ncbi:hypothetical protein RJ640_025019, partial [Escallonia rubra]
MYRGLGQLDAMNLFAAMVNRKRRESPPVDTTLVLRLKRSRPKQLNSSDCGFFVCMYMDYICRSESLKKTVWSQECIDCF